MAQVTFNVPDEIVAKILASLNGSPAAVESSIPEAELGLSDAPADTRVRKKKITLTQLKKRAKAIFDAGNAEEITKLFKEFGIPNLSALGKDKYDEFADRLEEIDG